MKALLAVLLCLPALARAVYVYQADGMLTKAETYGGYEVGYGPLDPVHVRVMIDDPSFVHGEAFSNLIASFWAWTDVGDITSRVDAINGAMPGGFRASNWDLQFSADGSFYYAADIPFYSYAPSIDFWATVWEGTLEPFYLVSGPTLVSEPATLALLPLLMAGLLRRRASHRATGVSPNG